MCVYCKGVPACDHERDACAASWGEVCTKCGHRSAAIVSYEPRPGGIRPMWRVLRKLTNSTGTVAAVDGEEARLIKMSVLQQGSTSETHRPSSAWLHARYHACVRLIASLFALIVEDKKVDVFGALR